ncbi:hypothetical protein Moror_1759 [Moniliophthora roreri MCA 2997]|uniref:Uncharacterized protein n=1 Tax=Moniliophthora roreri (strain MCA 2997) TaxID=1381753 RepID=V2XI60_MONRO|nr:hypothetical protein Moror_1759 [Moniliophthora roreri MCA 2997]
MPVAENSSRSKKQKGSKKKTARSNPTALVRATRSATATGAVSLTDPVEFNRSRLVHIDSQASTLTATPRRSTTPSTPGRNVITVATLITDRNAQLSRVEVLAEEFNLLRIFEEEIETEQPLNNNEMLTAGNAQRLQWDDLPQDQLDKLAEGNVRKILHIVKSFDEDEPDTLQAWLDDLEIQYKMAGLTEGASKIYSTMWKMSYKLCTELQGSDEAKGNSWEDFKKLLFKEFPDSADTDNGLTDKLYRIVLQSQYIGFGGLEKLKKYNRAFLLEVKKLLKPLALLSNHVAVQTCLSTFESMFKARVQQRMELFMLNKLDKGKEDSRRRQDPWELKDVIEQAEIVMSTSSGNIYFLNSHQSAISEETQPIILGMAFSMEIPILLTNVQVKAVQGQVPSQAVMPPAIKQEEIVPSLFPKKEEWDSDIYNLGVAATVDAHQCTI